MQFAVSLPPWMLVLIAIAIAIIAAGTYAGSIAPLSRVRRVTLAVLRAVTLLLIVACLLRPIRMVPPDVSTDAAVAILVDVSRSMRLADAEGRPRIDSARDIVQRLRSALNTRFKPELWTFGDVPARSGGQLAADATRSNLSAALRVIRDRYRGKRIAGVIVISDGGDTSVEEPAGAVEDGAMPIYTVGIGDTRAPDDLEVLDVTAGEAALSDSSIDLTVAAVNRGGSAPFDLRVLENGRPIDVRRVTPAAGGGPVQEVFTVSPARDAPTLYTVEIPSTGRERVVENNRRSVLVEPPGRRRRILMVEGAPGYEHSFIKRALEADPGLEVDAVVRKGQDAGGSATYFVQADAARAPQLASGFPHERDVLFQYDALILANIDPDALSRGQLESAADFVGERGGGVIVLGAKSFARQGLVGTALEQALPLALNDRGGGVVRTSGPRADLYTVDITEEGAVHPVMHIGASREETSKRWKAVPALAGAAQLGTLRPGAQVLAVVRADDGVRPLVAVQRYGQGRSLLFTGEASWRWRMQMPSSDRTFELFWRQAARWLCASTPPAVAVSPMTGIASGDTLAVSVVVRDRSFAPVSDAQITMRVRGPAGETHDVRATLADPRAGRYAGQMRFGDAGVYHVTAEARRGATVLGSSDRWILAGGADAEMSDPRLNPEVLRRVARASGGRYLAATEVATLPSLMSRAAPAPAAPQVRELWHNAWIFGVVVTLMALEWVLRREWGLR